jgi:hypothetical protein
MAEIETRKNKTCPYCFVPLSLDAETCFSCKKTVGKIDKHGMAKKPVNIWSYIVCFLAWAGFFIYIMWAFF